MKMTAKFEAEGENFNTCFEQLNSAFNAEFSASGGGQDGKDGATFIPSVSTEGVISWTNDRELPNPAPVNIKGEKGDKGERGERGLQGIQGVQGERGADGAKGDKGDKGDRGEQGIQGIQGEKGEKGDTGEAGKNGENGKDGYTPVKGVDYFDGKNGIDGEDGFSPVVAVDDIENGHRVTITDKSGAKTFDVMNGKDGTGGGGASVQADWSQNDPEANDYVKNRTHYESEPPFDIQWDGDVAGRFALDMSLLGYPQGTYYVKMNDLKLSTDDVIGTTIATSRDAEEIVTAEFLDTMSFPGAFVIVDVIVCVFDGTQLCGALGLPDGYITNGVYFLLDTSHNFYATKLTASPKVVKIPDKFLPDFSTVALTGEYEDLKGLPTIPKDLLKSAGLNLTDSEKNTFYLNVSVPSNFVVFAMLCGVISEYAFRGATKHSAQPFYLTSSMITRIEKGGFYSNYSLMEINLPNIISLGENAFADCKRLEKADLHNVDTINYSAFSGCQALKTVIIRRTDKLCAFGGRAFHNTPITSGEGFIYVPSVLINEYKSTNLSTYSAQIRAIEDYPDICGD